MKDSNEVWTIGSILTWTRQYFDDKGVENPRLDAEVLLSHILGKDRLYLYVNFDQPLQKLELQAFREVVKQRARHIPVAHILGRKEFMRLEFHVSNQVLIPRPDTEILVEKALLELKNKGNPSILDLGTGSGAIIISVLVNKADASGVGLDISKSALQIAEKNAEKHQVLNRLTLLESNGFTKVLGKKFDAIVSNPPYIPAEDIAGLTEEVKKEPMLALVGGKDGLDFYRIIINQAASLLNPGGFIALEVGIKQAEQVCLLANNTGMYNVGAVVKDYAGIDRVVLLTLREEHE